MRLTIVLLLVAVALPLVYTGSFIETIYTGTFASSQVAPIPTLSDSTGTLVCVYDRNSNPKTLDCEVQHSILGATVTTIHFGKRGVSGPILYNFPVQPEGIFGTNFRTIFAIADQVDFTVAQQEHDLLNGFWYALITSEEFEGGEIRAQIEHQDRFYARMNSENTIPIASGSTAVGLGLATYTNYRPKRTMQVDIVHSVSNAIGAETRHAQIGSVGPLVHSFDRAENVPIIESVAYTIGEEFEIFNEEHYLTILSASNPNGDIRGQWDTIDPYPEIALTARLEGKQVVPSVDTRSRGCGIFAYDCETFRLEYLVFHNVPDVIGASINAGNPGASGSPFFTLSRHENPIFGARILNREEEFLFFNQQLYVSITSVENPTGEVRGQITAEYDFFAYLSGTWATPPVSTNNIGCAVFRLKNNRRVLSYSVHHSVDNSIGVEIGVGVVGQNQAGIADKVLRRTGSPIIGDDEDMDDDELDKFLRDQMYVKVRSAEHPNGEIRGQINRIKPCIVSRESTLTIDSEVIESEPSYSVDIVEDDEADLTYTPTSYDDTFAPAPPQDLSLELFGPSAVSTPPNGFTDPTVDVEIPSLYQAPSNDLSTITYFVVTRTPNQQQTLDTVPDPTVVTESTETGNLPLFDSEVATPTLLEVVTPVPAVPISYDTAVLEAPGTIFEDNTSLDLFIPSEFREETISSANTLLCTINMSILIITLLFALLA